MDAIAKQDREALVAQVGTTERIHAALQQVAVEGWDGAIGRAVLEYARLAIVAPAVRSVGFTGGDAEFAEATGWAAAWESLSSRSIRSSESPWGVVSRAVRAAVLNERMAEIYGTDARSAWRVHRFRQAHLGEGRTARGDWLSVADPTALSRPLSLTALVDSGYEPPANAATWGGPNRLPAITELLVRHGWQRATAEEAVLHVADHARQNPKGHPKAHGWREMSLELGIPPWQARRVTVLLLGTETWPGLVERLAHGGEPALATPAVQAAVRATVDEGMRPPARAALAIEAQTARQPAMAS
jgi:hypothetical protein